MRGNKNTVIIYESERSILCRSYYNSDYRNAHPVLLCRMTKWGEKGRCRPFLFPRAIYHFLRFLLDFYHLNFSFLVHCSYIYYIYRYINKLTIT